MKPLVFLRADAGRTTGYGHLVRTCALAGYLAQKFHCIIYSWNIDTTFPSWIMNQGADAEAELRCIPAPDLETANEKFLSILAGKSVPPLVVLDNYYFSTDYQRAVRQLASKLVCLDDMHDRHFVADILISFVPLPPDRFSMEPYTLYLSGFQWAFLRKPFFRLLPPESRKRRSLLLAMGGADPYGLVPKLLPMVRDAYPDLVIEIVAGSAAVLDSSVDFTHRTVVHSNVDANEMVDIFDRCCLAILPASTLCIEAFARNVPVAAGYFVDNQLDFYNTATERNMIYPLGCLPELTADSLPSLPLPAFSGFVNEACEARRVLPDIFTGAHPDSL